MQLSELDNKYGLLVHENERLLRVIKERDTEIGEWTQRLHQADSDRDNQMKRIKEKLELSFAQRLVSSCSILACSLFNIMNKNVNLVL